MSGFGDALRHARSNKGVTLAEAERALRIPQKYLRALEDEDFALLPQGVYSRGIVRNYAQYLHLDPDDAIAYFEELRGHVSGGFKVVPAVRTIETPSHWVPNFASIAFVVVVGAVLFAWLYSAFFARGNTLPTPTAGLPTPTVVDVRPAVLALTPPPTSTPGPTNTPAPPEPTITPVPPSAAAQPSSAPPAAKPSTRPAAQKTPTPPPVNRTHVVTIQALEDSWVTVTVDDQLEYAGTMSGGQKANYEGKTIAIHTGNATKVYLWVDGEDRGLMSEDTWIADVTIP